MNTSRRWISSVLLGMVCATCGCGSAKTSTEVKSPAVTASETSDHLNSGDSSSKQHRATSTTTSLDDDSALATVQRTLGAIQRGDLAGAYEFLPPSYQSDVDSLVHEFASKMDAEVWTRLFATLRKSVEVLRTKKAFIMELDLFAHRPEYEPMRKHWDEAVSLLDQFATSRAGDLDSLKQTTTKSLLPGDASNIVRQLDAIGLGVGADLARQFADIKVEQIKVASEEHVLTFQSRRDEQPVEIVYVKHDGRWLPKSLVTQWSAGIEADRVWLAKLPEQFQVAKPRVLEGLTQADGLLDQLLAAQNREQFQQAVGPAIVSLALAWPRMQQLAQQSATGQTDLPPVTIAINRELTENEQQKLVEAVLKPLNATGTDYTLLSNDGHTTCRLTRVADVTALRENLAKHFGLKSEDIPFDAESSRMSVAIE